MYDIIYAVPASAERFAHEAAGHVGYSASGGLHRQHEAVSDAAARHQGGRSPVPGVYTFQQTHPDGRLHRRSFPQDLQDPPDAASRCTNTHDASLRCSTF